MYKDVTGIILSGGKSSRMGTNKSLLKIGDNTVIEIMVRLMKSLFQNVIISTNSEEEYSFLDCPMVADIHRNAGPLAGIHSTLLKSTTEKNFIISCDVPLMSREMIEYFVEYKTEEPILISRAAGYLQPLVGIYKKRLLPLIEKILSENENKSDEMKKHLSLHALIDKTDTEIIDVTTLPFYSDKLFFNLNNKDDFEKLINQFD